MSFEKETLRDVYFKQQEVELQELIDPKTGLLGQKYSRIVPCPLCNHGKYETVFVKRGYTFVRCGDCRLVYTNPQVAGDVVEAAYAGSQDKNASRTTELWMQILLNEKETQWRKDYFNGILDQIESVVPQQGRLLDIGCAVGHFLTICRDRGWQTAGLELSDKGSSYCRNELKLEVAKKTLTEAAFKPNSFDAISLLGVLEHMTKPKDIFQEAVRTLKPGGALSIIVPNAYSLLTMMLREKAITFDGREHMIFFSMETLRKLFEDSGVEVMQADTVLTGIPNMAKYMQFNDPYYDEDKGYAFFPEPLRSQLNDEKGWKTVEKWILDNNLGLRLRFIGRKK